MRLRLSSFVALAAAVSLAGASVLRAEGDGTVVNTFNQCCPPWETHCFEGPPKIKFKPACPKPICPCGSFEHFGYYQTCWAPWPFPPDFGHCPVPPLAAVVPPSHARPPVQARPHDSLPDATEETPPPGTGR